MDSMGYRYYFQYTINGYSLDLEPGLPSLNLAIQTFKELSGRVGKERVIWRYDPIIITSELSAEYHKDRFMQIASELQGFTQRAVVSIFDEYRAAKGRLNRLGMAPVECEVTAPQFADLIRSMATAAAAFGMEIYSCAEPLDLGQFGIEPGKCIDADYIYSVFGVNVNSRKDKTQREECGCVVSKDIGQYDTCLHGCEYCYATRSGKLVETNRKTHDVNSPSLTGHYDCQPAKEAAGQQSLFESNGGR